MKTPILFSLLLATAAHAQNRFVTLEVVGTAPYEGISTLIVRPYETAELVSIPSGNGLWFKGTAGWFLYQGQTQPTLQPLVLTGPATIQLRGYAAISVNQLAASLKHSLKVRANQAQPQTKRLQ